MSHANASTALANAVLDIHWEELAQCYTFL